MQRALVALAAVLVLPGPLAPAPMAAQGGHAAPGAGAPAEAGPPRSAEALARYPQPVRVGDLAGRQVIENTTRQRVLGRVADVVRGDDGTDRLIVERRGLLGGVRRVAVPAAAMALLGDLVVLHDLDPAALAALPEAGTEGERLPPGATTRIGLARN